MQVTLDDFTKAASTMLDTVIIPEQTKPIIEWLCLYFGEDPEFEKQQPEWLLTDRPSLKKGIMLVGPNGTGKTFLFEVFNRLSTFGIVSRHYSMTDGRTVAGEISTGGYKALAKYTTGDKLFNEFGSEPNAKFYANEIDVMYEVVFEREKVFCSKGQRTHLTTNRSDKQLEKRYDSALFSRVRGMCNIVQYGDGSQIGSDLRGLSQRINTHINYADLPYRWQDYFGLITDIKNKAFPLEALPILIEEIETRLNSVKCLYPGVFGPYVDSVEEFLSTSRHPQNITQYARTIVPPEVEKSDNQSKGFTPLGDSVRENLKHLKNPDENKEIGN